MGHLYEEADKKDGGQVSTPSTFASSVESSHWRQRLLLVPSCFEVGLQLPTTCPPLFPLNLRWNFKLS